MERFKNMLKLAVLGCCLAGAACVTGQEEKGDSYQLVDVQHADCNLYMMIFKTGDGCSFRMAESGPCDSLSMSQFLKYYSSFLQQHKNSILKSKGNYFSFSSYGPVDVTQQVNIDELVKATETGLTIRVFVKQKNAKDLVLEVQ